MQHVLARADLDVRPHVSQQVNYYIKDGAEVVVTFASAKFQTGHCLPSPQERSTVRQQPFLSGIFGNVTQDIKAMGRQPLRTGFRGPAESVGKRGVGRLR